MNQKSNFTRKTLPAIAMAGPVSLWMILFVALPWREYYEKGFFNFFDCDFSF